MKKVIILQTLMLLAQFVFAQDVNFKNYSVGEGLAQSQVYDILQDQQGYLWMATRGGGLSKFDGSTFETFTERNGLPDNYISSLAEVNDQLWIGTDQGIARFDGQTFKTYLTDTELPVNVQHFVKDSSNVLWAGSNQGLFRFHNDTFKLHPANEQLKFKAIKAMVVDSENTIWFGTQNGLYQLKNEQLIKHKWKSISTNIQCLNWINNTLWIGGYGRSVILYNGHKFRTLPGKKALPSNLVHDIQEVDKSIWIGTQDKGLFVWNPKDSTFQNINEQKGLCKNDVRSIYVDAWKNRWIGTSGGGICLFSIQQFTRLHRGNGLNGNSIYALCRGKTGDLHVSASGKGFSTINDSITIHYNRKTGFKNSKVKAIHESRDGTLWLGTEGYGLVRKDSSRFKYITVNDGLAGNWIRDIIEDNDNNLWVATAGGGISKISVSGQDTLGQPIYQFRSYTTRQGLADNRINMLHIDQQNRLWFACRKRGIGFIAPNGKVKNFDKEDGLPDLNIRSLAEDNYGYLWLGSAGNGISRLAIYKDSFSIKTFQLNDGLDSENIYLLNIDQQQNLWAGSQSGVDLIRLNESRNIAEVTHFGKNEGFTGIETCQNAVISDQDGSIWFGTINGLMQYRPASILKNDRAPILHFKDIRLFYTSMSLSPFKSFCSPKGGLLSGLKLPFRQNHLGFEFKGLNLKNPDKVWYQWKLEGSEKDWSPLSKRNDVSYSNLSAGQYTFKVRAYNEDMVMTEVPLTASFSIKKPYWQTLWFYTAVFLTIVLFILGVIGWRISVFKSKAKQATERLTMEKNLLQLEQKALQLQMNPHFIFNALNSIQGLISKENPKEARYFLSKFSKLMRSTLEHSRQENISLDSEVQLLDSFLQLENFSRGDIFDYDISVHKNIDSEDLFIPPLMIQPFVENAIIHGVSHLDKRGLITISFERFKSRLYCTIQDNGVGLKFSKFQQQNGQHQSTALAVTRERLQVLLPENFKGNALDIYETNDDKGQCNGTKVVVVLPEVKGWHVS